MSRKRRTPGPGAGREPWGSLHPLLDLHGMTGDEARLRADSWLRARRDEGSRVVVVVTGRGNRSQGPPVLRGEVDDLLHALSGSVVARHELIDGGGAFRVELRRPAPHPRRSADAVAARRVRDAPSGVRRRAEEALWELGIAPTPALLQAEIQRILREEQSEGGRTGEE